MLFACLLVLTAVPSALLPKPSFPQYFAMPVSCLFLLLPYSCALQRVKVLTMALSRVLFALVLVSVAYNGRGAIHRLAERSGWSGLRVHDIAMSIRSAVQDNGLGRSGKIATLSPIFVVEANLPIYSELSTGPFLYRVGDLLSPEERDRFVGTSPSSIGDLLDEDPPAAIIVGFEGDLDRPLKEYAIMNSYRQIHLAGFDGELYVRP